MPVYALRIEYDGSRYVGWQRQPNGPSIQGLLEEVLATILRQPVAVVGAGRTDAGVHAREQVAHFQLEKPLQVRRLLAALNGLLPRDVRVWAAAEAPEGFHARYSAIRRTYRYYLSTVPAALDRTQSWFVPHRLDWDRMQEAGLALPGEHDFRSFCRSADLPTRSRCLVYAARWCAHPLWPHRWYFEITANRFLRGMVRLLVGTFVEIGRGRLPVEILRCYLEEPQRHKARYAAPAHGLVLESVEYGEELPWVYAGASGVR